MNKADLTEALAERADIPKVRAAQYINILVESIHEALVSGEKVTISDFGTFTVRQRKGFNGRNPRSGQPQAVGPKRMPQFRAGKGLNEALNPEDEASAEG